MKKNKDEKKNAMADIKHVEEILQKWDPINVIEDLIESGLPPDEYDSYAPHILSMLRQGADEYKIAKHLGNLQTSSMGLGAWSEKDNEIAKELVLWWRNKNK